MRKIILPILLLTLLLGVASAELIISEQPQSNYNLGDKLNTKISVTTNENTNDFLEVKLACANSEKLISTTPIFYSGEQETIEVSIEKVPLVKSLIGREYGTCKLKANLGEETISTNNFEITNKLLVTLNEIPNEFNPGETVTISGEAKTEDEKTIEGFIDFEIRHKESNNIITGSGNVSEGLFSIATELPENAAAGTYLIKVSVYSKDFAGEKTTQGESNQQFTVAQIPTNIEIFIEERNLQPPTELKVKAILHDQTGQKIDSTTIITIKKQNKILQQTEIKTDEFLIYPLEYNEAPAEFTIFTTSNQLSSESSFNILENKKIKSEIANRTLTVTNIGNVPYDKPLTVKIGEESKTLEILLSVDQTKTYILEAPDGEYNVEVLTEGETLETKKVFLTGQAVNVEEAKEAIVQFVTSPIIWIFAIIILAAGAFLIYRKGYKNTFIGKINLDRLWFKKKPGTSPTIANTDQDKKFLKPKQRNDSYIIPSKKKTEFSLSIQGEKQHASVIALKINNLEKLNYTENNSSNAFKQLSYIIDDKKATVYENQEYAFIIVAPTNTKTFDNEETAIEIAEKIQKTLKDYNRFVKEKINFGISINTGLIITKKDKQNPDNMQFMSLGNFISLAKKVASLSKEEVLLTKDLRDKLGSRIKAEKGKQNGTEFYKIQELRKQTGENKKFISNFVKRLEDANKAQAKKELEKQKRDSEMSFS